MRLAIIGLGRAGQVHFESLKRVPDVRVAAVCDPTDAAEAFAKEHDLRHFARPEQLFREVDLDAVVVSTPPDQHREISIQALEHGLHVLCEKPLALSMPDAVSMLQAANRVDKQLVLATKFRHVPGIVATRDLLTQGRLGKPIAFEVSFCAPVDMGGRWNAVAQNAGGGVVIDNGCHSLDVVGFLFGGVERVLTAPLRQMQEIEVEDSARIFVEAPDGIVGSIELSWSYATGKQSYISIQCERGVIEVRWDGTWYRENGGEWVGLGGAYEKFDCHARMHEAFRRTVIDGAAPWIRPDEALRTVGGVEAAYRSVQAGAWTGVDATRPGEAGRTFARPRSSSLVDEVPRV